MHRRIKEADITVENEVYDSSLGNWWAFMQERGASGVEAQEMEKVGHASTDFLLRSSYKEGPWHHWMRKTVGMSKWLVSLLVRKVWFIEVKEREVEESHKVTEA